MRTALMFFLLTSPALAQNDAATTSALSACGPTDVKFDVKLDQTKSPSEPPSGKSLVYVIEDIGQSEYGWITIRIGLDGSWIGANHGNSYFSFTVAPGEHHLCSNWQSKLKGYSSVYSLANFTAEAGKVYYFRTRIWFSRDMWRLDLDPVNSDQGRYQVAAFPLVISHAKK